MRVRDYQNPRSSIIPICALRISQVKPWCGLLTLLTGRVAIPRSSGALLKPDDRDRPRHDGLKPRANNRNSSQKSSRAPKPSIDISQLNPDRY